MSVGFCLFSLPSSHLFFHVFLSLFFSHCPFLLSSLSDLSLPFTPPSPSFSLPTSLYISLLHFSLSPLCLPCFALSIFSPPSFSDSISSTSPPSFCLPFYLSSFSLSAHFFSPTSLSSVFLSSLLQLIFSLPHLSLLHIFPISQCLHTDCVVVSST